MPQLFRGSRKAGGRDGHELLCTSIFSCFLHAHTNPLLRQTATTQERRTPLDAWHKPVALPGPQHLVGKCRCCADAASGTDLERSDESFRHCF